MEGFLYEICAILSISAISSGVRDHELAATLAETCPADVAPAITEARAGWARRRAKASSRMVCPRCSAKLMSASTTSRLCSENTRACCSAEVVVRRVPLRWSAPRRYLPVSRPLYSGKYGR